MAPSVPGVDARDLFPHGAFVRLQNRAQKTYLSADDDGEGVSMRSLGRDFSLNTVWRVHRVAIDAGNFVLLQGAAYGRYLATAPGIRAPSGCRGQGASQRDYDGNGGNGTNVNDLMWRPFRMVDDDRYIVLRHATSFNRSLRANGRYRFWHTAVTAGSSLEGWSTMMQWTVRRFEQAPELPPLPPPTANPGGLKGLLRRLRPEAGRTIRYVLANDEGDFDQNSDYWRTFTFNGCSVLNLMTRVGLDQPDGEVGLGMTLAVRPGLQGRLTPLVTDLPRNVDTMDIVVFKTGSQGAQQLAYPDIQ